MVAACKETETEAVGLQARAYVCLFSFDVLLVLLMPVDAIIMQSSSRGAGLTP